MNLDDEIASDAPPATDPYLGREFNGRYRVEERIAAGGMGTVYRGKHVELGTTVAIKVLHRHLATAKGSMLYQRFRNEARIAAQLKHPNIAHATDFGRTSDNVPYLVMEFLEGEPLSSYLETHPPLATAQGADIACHVLEALHAAHSVGIVHRDIKPDNIFVIGWEDAVPHIKVLDFGIAKLGDATVQTQAGHVLGTMAYMSPEQLQDTSQVDVRTDVYAVGVTLYQMLSGTLPFHSSSLTDLALQIMKGEPRRLESLRPDLPSKLTSLVHRAMAPTPGARPPSALAFLDELAPFSSMTSGPLAHGLIAHGPIADPPVEPHTLTDSRSRRRPSFFKLLAVATIFFFALALLAQFFSSDGKQTASAGGMSDEIAKDRMNAKPDLSTPLANEPKEATRDTSAQPQSELVDDEESELWDAGQLQSDSAMPASDTEESSTRSYSARKTTSRTRRVSRKSTAKRRVATKRVVKRKRKASKRKKRRPRKRRRR